MNDSESANTPPVRAKRHRRIAAMVVAVVLFYFLSVGPAVLCVSRGILPIETVGPVYIPIEWLLDNTFLHAPLDWYISLWVAPEPGARQA